MIRVGNKEGVRTYTAGHVGQTWVRQRSFEKLGSRIEKQRSGANKAPNSSASTCDRRAVEVEIGFPENFPTDKRGEKTGKVMCIEPKLIRAILVCVNEIQNTKFHERSSYMCSRRSSETFAFSSSWL